MYHMYVHVHTYHHSSIALLPTVVHCCCCCPAAVAYPVHIFRSSAVVCISEFTGALLYRHSDCCTWHQQAVSCDDIVTGLFQNRSQPLYMSTAATALSASTPNDVTLQLMI